MRIIKPAPFSHAGVLGHHTVALAENQVVTILSMGIIVRIAQMVSVQNR